MGDVGNRHCSFEAQNYIAKKKKCPKFVFFWRGVSRENFHGWIEARCVHVHMQLHAFSFVRTILIYKNNEAQLCPKVKNELRTIEARLQMWMLLQVFIEKHKTSCPYMWRFIAGLSAVSWHRVSREESQNRAARVLWQCRSEYTSTAILNLCWNSLQSV